MPFTVTVLPHPVRLYQLRYPVYSPSIMCTTFLQGECTVYKHTADDDALFEALSIQFDPRQYSVFSVHEDCPGINHVGIVHFLSGLFSKADIPILYVNTYASNLVFISDEFCEKAISLMKDQDIVMEFN